MVDLICDEHFLGQCQIPLYLSHSIPLNLSQSAYVLKHMQGLIMLITMLHAVVDLICDIQLFGRSQFLFPYSTYTVVQTQALIMLITMLQIACPILHCVKCAIVIVSKLYCESKAIRRRKSTMK